MQRIESYQRPAFLRDHPPVLARRVLASTGSEETYLAGTVLGRGEDGSLGLWTAASKDIEGILAGDVTVPAEGGVSVDVYIHASVVPQELIFADGVSADAEQTALAQLRAKGIY